MKEFGWPHVAIYTPNSMKLGCNYRYGMFRHVGGFEEETSSDHPVDCLFCGETDGSGDFVKKETTISRQFYTHTHTIPGKIPSIQLCLIMKSHYLLVLDSCCKAMTNTVLSRDWVNGKTWDNC